MITYENIDVAIKNILHDKFNILLENDVINLNFFNPKVGMDEIDLIYLINILEEKYNIKFIDEDIDNENFYTLKGICHIIIQKGK